MAVLLCRAGCCQIRALPQLLLCTFPMPVTACTQGRLCSFDDHHAEHCIVNDTQAHLPAVALQPAQEVVLRFRGELVQRPGLASEHIWSHYEVACCCQPVTNLLELPVEQRKEGSRTRKGVRRGTGLSGQIYSMILMVVVGVCVAVVGRRRSRRRRRRTKGAVHMGSW